MRECTSCIIRRNYHHFLWLDCSPAMRTDLQGLGTRWRKSFCGCTTIRPIHLPSGLLSASSQKLHHMSSAQKCPQRTNTSCYGLELVEKSPLPATPVVSPVRHDTRVLQTNADLIKRDACLLSATLAIYAPLEAKRGERRRGKGG